MTTKDKAAHTPGPWMIQSRSENYHFIDAEDLDAMNIRVAGNNNEANARLIAASPDLLSSAQRAFDHLSSFSMHQYTDTMTDASKKNFSTMLANLENAIARAEGGK